MRPPNIRPAIPRLASVLLALALLPVATAQERRDGASELARIKQEEAREKLKRLEETMDRLARLLAVTEPQNAQKLRSAFSASRERLLREGMDRIVEFLREKKLDRALEDQTAVVEHLRELLDLLLERDIDPRELIRHIKRLKGVLEDLDRVVREETAEKIASDQAAEAESPLEQLSEAVARLDDLIRRERGIEGRIATAAGAASGAGEGEGGGRDRPAGEEREKKDGDLARKLAELAPEQEAVRADTGKLRDPGGSEGGPNPSSALDEKSLAAAAAAMAGAAGAMKAGAAGAAGKAAAEARAHLESARRAAEDELDRLRSKRDFGAMKREQDETLGRTRDLIERMQKPPPLVASPEGGVPGQDDVAGASSSMESASGSLGGGKARPASGSQQEALTRLDTGRRKVEDTLEALQEALRSRLLAYLRERFTHMLERQRRISRETRSLDSRLRALAAVELASDSPEAEAPADSRIDRKDLQRAESLSRGEGDLAAIAGDIIDLLEEDGTTLVFPRIVDELRGDIDNVRGLLARVQTGELAQRIQSEIEQAIEEILEAIKEAQRNPPPPSPNSGRQSRSGAGPLLPTSAELKMIRSMQQRVNERTGRFHLDRAAAALDLEGQRQARIIADRQREIEDLFRKVARGL